MFFVVEESSVDSESEADLLGEGGETGEINTAQSLVYTALQVKFFFFNI